MAPKSFKFKILQANRWFMTSILRIDMEQQNNRWTKSTNRFFASYSGLLILSILCGVLISSIVRASTDSLAFTSRLTAFMTIVAMCQAITIFLNTGMNMQNLTDLFQMLQTIVDDEGWIDWNFL